MKEIDDAKKEQRHKKNLVAVDLLTQEEAGAFFADPAVQKFYTFCNRHDRPTESTEETTTETPDSADPLALDIPGLVTTLQFIETLDRSGKALFFIDEHDIETAEKTKGTGKLTDHMALRYLPPEKRQQLHPYDPKHLPADIAAEDLRICVFERDEDYAHVIKKKYETENFSRRHLSETADKLQRSLELIEQNPKSTPFNDPQHYCEFVQIAEGFIAAVRELEGKQPKSTIAGKGASISTESPIQLSPGRLGI